MCVGVAEMTYFGRIASREFRSFCFVNAAGKKKLLCWEKRELTVRDVVANYACALGCETSDGMAWVGVRVISST